MDNNFSAHIIAINKTGEVLLVKRRDVQIWVIPGGKAEVGEKPEQTAVREFLEETEVSVRKNDIKLVVHYLPATAGKRHKYSFLTKLKKSVSPTTTNESSDFGFFSIDRLPEPMSVYEKQRIIDVIHGYKSLISKTDNVNYYLEFKKLSKNPLLLIKLFLQYVLVKVKNKT